MPTLLEFGKWGSQFIGEDTAAYKMVHLGSYALTPQTFFRPPLAKGLDKIYALHIGNEIQTVHIVNGTIDVKHGEPTYFDMALFADLPVYLGLLTREVDPKDALANGLAKIEGDPAELFRFLELCGMPTVG